MHVVSCCPCCCSQYQRSLTIVPRASSAAMSQSSELPLGTCLSASGLEMRVKKWQRYLDAEKAKPLYVKVALLKDAPPGTPPCSPPITPRPSQDISKRSWDCLAAEWRRKMKAWDSWADDRWTLPLDLTSSSDGEAEKEDNGCRMA